MIASRLTVVAFLITTLTFASAKLKWHTNERLMRTTGASSNPAFSAAEVAFIALRDGSIRYLSSSHRPILIHTRQEAQDTIVFVRSDNTSFNVPICPPGYLTLQAIGHLPVSVLLALEQENETSLSGVTTLRLQSLQNLSQILLSSINKQSVQSDILTATSSFISQLLAQGGTLSTTSGFIQSLSNQLKSIAREAVMIYLVYLNNTITSLIQNGSISAAEFNSMSVAIALSPFIETQSFLEQYYTALLSLQPPTTQRERVLLLYQYWDSQSCSVPSTDLVNTSICSWSSTAVRQNISQVFYGAPNSSVHLLLSQAASDVICSDLYFPLCRKVSGTGGLYGFDSRTQRVYVVVVIYLGTTVIVLTIILLTLCKEGEKMKMERRTERKSQILLNAHAEEGL